MANSLQLNTASVFAGLGTTTFTVVTAGLYTVNCQSNIPYRASGSPGDSTSTAGGSALQIVINQNGSPVVTVGGSASNPTPTQPLISASARINTVATDVLTVVLSSANAVDALPNSVKSIINVYQGE